ncbi:heavy-metal-associated domain-containing protein [Polaribacter sp. SA4-12]|uniref:heavy-metal-associated domain-containing protein n=1 Tax=Polaribacter sp. SA4-12 TaxID=1312072 RepID=UPI000B3CF13E|nr:heavy metal-associated domain-containing protein [Polaribacter sp. SA4-12]
MKTKKILFSVAIALFILTGCKSEAKKEVLPVDKQNVSLAISGMTCEIGCAKTIQSKLSKKKGVLDAKVIFKDSIANVEFDANTTSKKDLIAFVDGIAGGELYKASENAQSCKGKNKANCANKKDCKKADCNKKDCSADKKCDTKKQCKPDCKKACCSADKKSDTKTACKADCKKECCANKKTA